MSGDVPAWMPPPGPGPREDACGIAFDAVTMPAFIGNFILCRLGDHSGTVIEDRGKGALTWLIRPGTGRLWPIPSIQNHGAGQRILVPPPLPLPGARLRWRIPLAADRYLTDADHLQEAITSEWAPFQATGQTAVLESLRDAPRTPATREAMRKALRAMRHGPTP